MKFLLLLIAVATYSVNIYAEDSAFVCPESNREIVALITAQDVYCSDAVNIASQCAFGSSRDLEIAGAAKSVCLKEAGQLSTADQSLLASMEARCNQTYSGLAGTMYMSMNAFCHLQAVEFIRSVQSEDLNL